MWCSPFAPEGNQLDVNVLPFFAFSTLVFFVTYLFHFNFQSLFPGMQVTVVGGCSLAKVAWATFSTRLFLRPLDILSPKLQQLSYSHFIPITMLEELYVSFKLYILPLQFFKITYCNVFFLLCNMNSVHTYLQNAVSRN